MSKYETHYDLAVKSSIRLILIINLQMDLFPDPIVHSQLFNVAHMRACYVKLDRLRSRHVARGDIECDPTVPL